MNGNTEWGGFPGIDSSDLDPRDVTPTSGTASSGQATPRAVVDWDQFVDRAAEDAGYVFEEDQTAKLVDLQEQDPAAWHRLRARLKRCRFSILDLDAAVKNLRAGKQTQADVLLGLAEQADLFHDPNWTPFARVEVGGHVEVHRVSSRAFRDWLTSLYFDEFEKAPHGYAVKEALATLEARATRRGEERPVFLRCARLDDRIYIDLCDDRWRVVEVTAHGWSILDESPVLFERSATMRPLPEPVRGGSVDDLRSAVNVQLERDWTLVKGWWAVALSGLGSYLVLGVNGEKGCAKTTLLRILRRVSDPADPPLRSLPKTERDLVIAASKALVAGFDNVSQISADLSDCLCRLATGGGSGGRQLYSDREEVVFSDTRPVLLNGIGEVVQKDDLLDRSIVLELPVIPAAQRLDEDEIEALISPVLPGAFGGMLDALVAGLAGMEKARQRLRERGRRPRMALQTTWVTAAESALGIEEFGFVEALESLQATSLFNELDADPIYQALSRMMREDESLACAYPAAEAAYQLAYAEVQRSVLAAHKAEHRTDRKPDLPPADLEALINKGLAKKGVERPQQTRHGDVCQVEQRTVRGSFQRTACVAWSWLGSASDLLEVARQQVVGQARRQLPVNARTLSTRLKRKAEALRRVGITVEWAKENGRRLIVIDWDVTQTWAYEEGE